MISKERKCLLSIIMENILRMVYNFNICKLMISSIIDLIDIMILIQNLNSFRKTIPTSINNIEFLWIFKLI